MGPLSIGLFMAAAVFWAGALFHVLIWVRRRGMKVHLWFALTALLSGFAAITEAAFYNAGTVAAFNEAFRWSNNINVLWLVSLIGFVVCYTGTWPARRMGGSVAERGVPSRRTRERLPPVRLSLYGHHGAPIRRAALGRTYSAR